MATRAASSRASIWPRPSPSPSNRPTDPTASPPPGAVTRLSAEGTANASVPASAAQFKVVYAYAADRPNRFAGFADALQADVAITERFLSAQSGGTKAIRFDMGTRCGQQYIDLQVVALPGPRSAYAGDFAAITDAVGRALGTPAGPRNTVILADSLSNAGRRVRPWRDGHGCLR